MSEFDPINCPVGIKNCSEIERVKDRLDMAIERLEERMDDMKEDLTTHMNEGFSNVNEKLDTLNNRMDSFETDLDSRIDERIERHKGKVAAGAWKYLFIGICIPVIINLITAIIKAKIG